MYRHPERTTRVTSQQVGLPIVSERLIVSALLVSLTLLFVPRVAQAQEPLDPASILEVASEAWEKGPGLESQAAQRRYNKAADAVPGRLSDITVSSIPEFGPEGPLGDWMSDATIGIDLGSRASAMEALFVARAELVEAQADVARFEWQASVASLWTEVVTQKAMVTHLSHYRTEVEESLEPFREAASKQLLSRTDLADLEVEIARLSAEITRASQEVEEGSAALEAWLGTSVEMPDAELTEPGDEPPANPWDAAELTLDVHPFNAAAGAELNALEAEAKLADAATPWRLNAGVAVHRDPEGEVWVGPALSLTIPLRNDQSADAALAEGAVDVTREMSQWRFTRMKREIERQREEYNALATAWRDLNEGRLAAERERVEQLEASLAAGQITLERLTRARQDLHEAHHEMLGISARMLQHQLNARLLEALLQESTP